MNDKPSLWNKVYYYFEYILLRGVAGAVNAFPFTVSFYLARKVGDLLYMIMPKRRRIVFSNLEIAFGNSRTGFEKKEIAKGAFRSLATSLMEFFRIPKFLKEPEKHFTFKGIERMERAFERGKGIIWVLAHLGSWEYLTFLPYLKGWRCSVIGKPIRNPYVNQWIVSLRRATELNPFENKKSIRAVLSELRQNHLVAILIDQWAGGEGVWIDFFKEPTSTTSIPARLAKHTGAALIPAYCVRKGCGQYEIQIKEEVALDGDREDWEEETTHKLNQLLEKQILAYPEQWLWTHRRWKGYQRYQELSSNKRCKSNHYSESAN